MLQSPTDYLIAGLKTLQAMIVTSLKHLSQVLSAPAKKLESKLLQFASNAIIAVFGPEEHMEVPPQKLAVYESELL
uniref:Uncharacterized protein n=1 Tax=Amphimedon queenslandica TaxID=400682 RepID=A0A1X7SXZ2_AMPQE